MAKEAKRNAKAIFSYVNSKLKRKTGIVDLDIETGKATTDSEKAEALNTFVSDAFTDEDTSNIPGFHTEDIRKPLEQLKITEEEVKKRLESLNQHKSPRPDGLHPRVLKLVRSANHLLLLCRSRWMSIHYHITGEMRMLAPFF